LGLVHNLKPKKFLGQHFIWDDAVLARIADAAELKADDIVLEIGAGFGNLTKHLAARAKKVLAIEIDKKLVELVPDEIIKNCKVEFIRADVLKLDWAQFFSDERKIAVVGNIPYHITSPLIERIIEHRKNINQALMLVQQELAERIASGAGTKKYGSISVLCQTYSEVELLFIVPASRFRPRPNVGSRLIRLKLREEPPFDIPSKEDFEQTVRTFFSQRRKTIYNALKRCGVDEMRAQKILDNLNLERNLRPENLTPEIFAKISMKIKTG